MNYLELQRESYDCSNRDTEYSIRCLLNTFSYLGVPETLIDIGCGPGHLVQVANNLGVKARGYDLFVDNNTKNVSQLDLRNELPELDSVEMVLCWEVAEHIPIEHSDKLCVFLSGFTGKYLLFSAAVPDQGGPGHVNEQDHDYWVDKLEQLQLRYQYSITEIIRRAFKLIAPKCWWYGKNIMLFKKSGDY